MTLTILPANGALLEDWRAVHNSVIAPVQLNAGEVVERAIRNDLIIGYIDGVLVGNATVRTPHDGEVTVIVRILPEHCRQGLGSEYLQVLVHQTRISQAERITTVVLAANVDGLAFAIRHGFVETERYEVDGVGFVDLTLQDATA